MAADAVLEVLYEVLYVAVSSLSLFTFLTKAFGQSEPGEALSVSPGSGALLSSRRYFIRAQYPAKESKTTV